MMLSVLSQKRGIISFSITTSVKWDTHIFTMEIYLHDFITLNKHASLKPNISTNQTNFVSKDLRSTIMTFVRILNKFFLGKPKYSEQIIRNKETFVSIFWEKFETCVAETPRKP